MFGGIEAGGTKFNCIIAEDPDRIISEKRIPTTQPEVTLQEVNAFFSEWMKATNTKLQSIGVGCFGPLDLDPNSPTFGSITSTPKIAWQNFNVKATIENILNIPTVIDTDVNAAAMGEYLWGAGKDKGCVLYVTIGTGIGGGIVIDGKPLHGNLHPEMGHFFLPMPAEDQEFPGVCPFHGNCFEGLASGPALQERWGVEAQQLPQDHPAWDLEAKYVALAICAYTCNFSPNVIILGGGVMQQTHLFHRIRLYVQEYLNDYIRSDLLLHHMDDYIVAPGLGNRAGTLGSIALARSAIFKN